MRWTDIPMHPTTATLRWFAGIGTGLLVTLAAVQWFANDNAIAAALLAGCAMLAAGLAVLAPRAVRPIFVGMIIVTFPLSWLVTHLLLAAVFYCLFTPLALWFKLIGRDALALRIERDRASYWIARPSADNVRRYFRQS
jgi:hypothetical protein